jgi:hypothetical protein
MDYYQLLLEADATAYLDRIKAGQIKAINPETFFSKSEDANEIGKHVLEHVIDVVKARSDWQLQLARFLKQFDTMDKIAKLYDMDGKEYKFPLNQFLSTIEGDKENSEDYEEIFKNQWIRIIHPRNYSTAKKYGRQHWEFIKSKEYFTNFIHSEKGGGKLYYIWTPHGGDKPVAYINGYEFENGKQKRLVYSNNNFRPEEKSDNKIDNKTDFVSLEMLLDPYYKVPRNIITDLFGKNAPGNYYKMTNSARSFSKISRPQRTKNIEGEEVTKHQFKNLTQARLILEKYGDKNWKTVKEKLLDAAKRIIATAESFNQKEEFKATDLINKKYKTNDIVLFISFTKGSEGKIIQAHVYEQRNIKSNSEIFKIQGKDTITQYGFAHPEIDKKVTRVLEKYKFLNYENITAIKNEYRSEDFYSFESQYKSRIYVIPLKKLEMSIPVQFFSINRKDVSAYYNEGIDDKEYTWEEFKQEYPILYKKFSLVPSINKKIILGSGNAPSPKDDISSYKDYVERKRKEREFNPIEPAKVSSSEPVKAPVQKAPVQKKKFFTNLKSVKDKILSKIKIR